MKAMIIWNMSSNMELYKDYPSFKGHEYIMSFISEFTIMMKDGYITASKSARFEGLINTMSDFNRSCEAQKATDCPKSIITSFLSDKPVSSAIIGFQLYQYSFPVRVQRRKNLSIRTKRFPR